MRFACTLAGVSSVLFWALSVSAQPPPGPGQPMPGAPPPPAPTHPVMPTMPGATPPTTTALPPPGPPGPPIGTPAAPPPAASAEPPEPPEPLMKQGMIGGESDESGDRTLLGHTFHYPLLLDNAFTAASIYVGSSIEFYHQGDVPAQVKAEDGTILKDFTFDRDLGFVRLRYGVDFQPSQYFSFGLESDYLAEVGANEETLFLYGGQTGFDFRPNLKVRLVRNEKTGSQLGLRAHGTFQGGIRAVPQGLLTELEKQLSTIANDIEKQKCLVAADFECAFAAAGTDMGEAIKLTRKRYGGGGSLNYAQALNKYLGGQASIGIEGATTTVSAPIVGDIEASGLRFHLAASPSLNLYPKLPVGLVFEYRFQLDKQNYAGNEKANISEEEGVSAISHRMGWGLYYTGRRDLLLGWIAGINFLQDVDRALNEAEDQPDAFVFAAQFEMRYFF